MAKRYAPDRSGQGIWSYRGFTLTAAAAGPMSPYGGVEHYDLVLGRLLAGIFAGASPTG